MKIFVIFKDLKVIKVINFKLAIQKKKFTLLFELALSKVNQILNYFITIMIQLFTKCYFIRILFKSIIDHSIIFIIFIFMIHEKTKIKIVTTLIVHLIIVINYYHCSRFYYCYFLLNFIKMLISFNSLNLNHY